MVYVSETPLIERVRGVLEAVGVKDVSSATKEQVILALGRLLSVKLETPFAEKSVHEVTKEVRRALELAVKSPISKDLDEAVMRAVYTNPPFESEALNVAYRELLKRLVRDTAEASRELTPMWRKRLINLTIENLYNIATAGETIEYRKKIFEAIKREGGAK